MCRVQGVSVVHMSVGGAGVHGVGVVPVVVTRRVHIHTGLQVGVVQVLRGGQGGCLVIYIRDGCLLYGVDRGFRLGRNAEVGPRGLGTRRRNTVPTAHWTCVLAALDRMRVVTCTSASQCEVTLPCDLVLLLPLHPAVTVDRVNGTPVPSRFQGTSIFLEKIKKSQFQNRSSHKK